MLININVRHAFASRTQNPMFEDTHTIPITEKILCIQEKKNKKLSITIFANLPNEILNFVSL